MSAPSLDSEYSDTTALATRIDTHARYSQHPDDPISAVLDALRLTGTEDLADIGCGDARFLMRVADSDHHGRLVGVDNAPAMVAAAAQVPGAAAVLADATRIPFPDNTFDIATARHMLYHLAAPLDALQEWRRITKPSGRVVVTVNHANTCHRTHQLVVEHARRHGITEPAGLMNPDVHSGTIADMMSTVFPRHTVVTCDNTLVFNESAPVLRFAESLFSFCGIAADTPERPQILADLSDTLDTWFDAHPGQQWRDPKGYSIIVAYL
ncbi:methyltransferase domain-containing protein [Nocardia sp. R6R-6]|uniref:methyltransferase domain-containing protein n=1 Tax=Nocardia sp. R6R-6 TaxID=3459303 RepID=UPI00403DAC2F